MRTSFSSFPLFELLGLGSLSLSLSLCAFEFPFSEETNGPHQRRLGPPPKSTQIAIRTHPVISRRRVDAPTTQHHQDRTSGSSSSKHPPHQPCHLWVQRPLYRRAFSCSLGTGVCWALSVWGPAFTGRTQPTRVVKTSRLSDLFLSLEEQPFGAFIPSSPRSFVRRPFSKTGHERHQLVPPGAQSLCAHSAVPRGIVLLRPASCAPHHTS